MPTRASASRTNGFSPTSYSTNKMSKKVTTALPRDYRPQPHFLAADRLITTTTTTTTTTATTTPRGALLKLISLSSWVSNAREPETNDLWSRITSSRSVSQERLRQEDFEVAVGLAKHRLNLLTRFSITGSRNDQWQQQQTQQQQTHLVPVTAAGVDLKQEMKIDGSVAVIASGSSSTESKKQNARSLWHSSKRTAAFDLRARDWVALSALTVATLGVRFWRISWPDEVIQYPGWVPYASMRATMAMMGAFCAPMAYATLKTSGHGAPAAILASTLVAFDNALTANNRMMALDAPLMFFTAATIMSWSLFIKKPFTGFWWTWLLAMGVSMAGAMSVKLVGIVSVLTTLYFATLNLWALARDKSVNTTAWLKHCAARVSALVVLPLALYLIIFQLHFLNETHQPDYRTSARAESDLDQLSLLYRHSLISHYPAEDNLQTWRDVVYGSVVQIQSESKAFMGGGGVYLHSSAETNPGGTRQQVLSGYSYPDINTQWIVIKAEVDTNEPEEIPSRLELLKNGDLLRLRHVSTRKCMHSHNHRTYTNPQNIRLNEVSAYGGAGFDGDSNDWWVVETVDSETLREGTKEEKEPIRAMETTFRLRHFELGCFLFASDSPLLEPWGEGRSEVVCRSDVRVTGKSVWRISSNRHNYLPTATPKTTYPAPSFWAKLVEMHELMWSYQGPLEENLQISSSTPRQWPLAQSMILAWSCYQRQMAIVANPAVWWTSALGLGIYLASLALFAIRQKRGYYETGRLGEFQRFHLKEAGTFFTGWALHYLPFFFVDRVLYMHHYFPSLYFSILLTSSVLSGLAGFLPRLTRLGLFLGLILLTIATFVRLSPLSYGSEMTRERCEAVSQWANPRRGYFNNELNCEIASLSTDQPKLLSVMKQQGKADKLLSKRQRHEAKTVASQGPQPTNKNAGPAGSTIATTAAANNHFLTAEPILGSTGSGASGLLHSGGTSNNGKNRLSVSKPMPKIRAPILPMRLPPIKRRLPVPDIVLLPYQPPPQHWDRFTQMQMLARTDLNLYERAQIQQLVRGEYQKTINNEDDETDDDDNGVQDDQSQEEKSSSGGEGGEGGKGSVVEERKEEVHQEQVDADKAATRDQKAPSKSEHLDAKIDEVLERFWNRNQQAAAASYNRIQLPQEQQQVDDDDDDDEADIKAKERRGLGGIYVPVAIGIGGNDKDKEKYNHHHTAGLAQPLKFEARKSFKRQKQMMDAALVMAKKHHEQAKLDKLKGYLSPDGLYNKFFPTKENLAEQRALKLKQEHEAKVAAGVRKEKARLAREERIKERFERRKEGMKVCGNKDAVRDVAGILKQVTAEDDEAHLAGFYDDEGEDGDYVHGVYQQIKAQQEVFRKMTKEEKDAIRAEKTARLQKLKDDRAEKERIVMERKRLRDLLRVEAEATEQDSDDNDESEADADAEEVNDQVPSDDEQQQEGDSEVEDEVEFEMRGPPISVGSANPPTPVNDGDDDGGDNGDYYEEDSGYYNDEDEGGEERGDEEDNQEMPPPIAVKNAEELAAVLEKLAADGVPPPPPMASI
ncbi:hypothetical protein BGX23_008226 [Mortierella sp. AD031]|nr:hypothetical protein BGX23_008226 [Mortierella sp. AD031]